MWAFIWSKFVATSKGLNCRLTRLGLHYIVWTDCFIIITSGKCWKRKWKRYIRLMHSLTYWCNYMHMFKTATLCYLSSICSIMQLLLKRLNFFSSPSFLSFSSCMPCLLSVTFSLAVQYKVLLAWCAFFLLFISESTSTVSFMGAHGAADSYYSTLRLYQ